MQSMTVRDILRLICRDGDMSSPRGEDVLEYEYLQCEIKHPWSLYPHRNYNLDYFRREMQWYLGADQYDHRICQYATMWKKLVQPDGAILSNYGYYWFGPQNGFKWVCDTLKADPASRQAYIAMNNYSHAYPGNPDFVCTKGIQFRIKYGLVNMHVAMRSSDAIYGLGTDLPCFYTLWHMVCKELDRAPGKFIFSADSVHIYERHFEMTENIIKYDYDVDDILAPMPTITDVNDLLEGRYESKFGCWLMEAPL